MKKLKDNKAITLIVLVITIVVILILASVSIAMLTGENGIIERAKNAKEETENAEEQENITLANYENKINEVVGSNRLDTLNNVETGIATIPSGISWRKVYIEFNKSFSNPPIVLTQPMQQNVDIDADNEYLGGNQWEVDNVTTQGFYIRYYNNSASGQVNFYWLAISN